MDMQDQEYVKQLFERYRQGKCTPEEQVRLHNWLNHYAAQEARALDDLSGMYEKRARRSKRWQRWLPYAAALVMVSSVAWYFWPDEGKDAVPDYQTVGTDDILPGGNRATLILADGSSIDLSEAQSGIVVEDKRVVYENGAGELIDLKGEVVPLVLSTPKGGTYQITLSDGTKVWLNAASTLRYPSGFNGVDRVVEVEGEAYFSVAKDAERPFKVVGRGQQIEVLGTAFNVMAYADEEVVKTTLVEGKVALKVEATGERVLLDPSEQSTLRGNGISKQTVDVGAYVAWKDGEFNLDNTPLVDMMKQMSRWYDVEVVYEHEVPKERFSGTVSRNVSLQTILALLRISEVDYRIENNTLIIN